LHEEQNETARLGVSFKGTMELLDLETVIFSKGQWNQLVCLRCVHNFCELDQSVRDNNWTSHPESLEGGS
jgi:hypothetical protein